MEDRLLSGRPFTVDKIKVATDGVGFCKLLKKKKKVVVVLVKP